MAPKSSREVETLVRSVLHEPLEDAVLRERLEELGQEPAFPGLTWLWGPELYRRNRVLFRPLILSRFGTWEWRGGWSSIRRIEWKGETGRILDAWMAEADRLDDGELFRQLYLWKNPRSEESWERDLVERFRAASGSAARLSALDKLDLRWWMLGQDTAIALYETDPRAAAPFILKHLPERGTGLWRDLMARARQRGDEGFALTLYRNLIESRPWVDDLRELCDRIADPAALCRALERHYPTGSMWDFDSGPGLIEVLRRRGRDVLPFVLPHLWDARNRWRLRGGANDLLRIARDHDWIDLWAAVLRTIATPDQVDAELRQLLKDPGRPPADVVRRLAALAGGGRIGSGPRGLSSVLTVKDATAVLLYERFPDLVRGPFKSHVAEGSPVRLTRAAIDARDEELVDFLASRMATRTGWGSGRVDEAEPLADEYAQLKASDPAAFSRRAAAVLGQIPAFSIFSYDRLVRSNRLARLLFERSAESFLADPGMVEDLLEAPEIHVQALAYRVLGLDDPRARQLAAARLDLLLATLLRPLHRTTRLLAFAALANAARVSAAAAARILARAREAFDLPDRGYPKEELAGLLGHILRLWPELRGPRERPVVWGSAA